MAVFLGHTPLTEKDGHTDFYVFCSTTCRKNMGFIRVIYANNQKIMAIRANTAKYGSLTEKKQPYGVPGEKIRTKDGARSGDLAHPPTLTL